MMYIARKCLNQIKVSNVNIIFNSSKSIPNNKNTIINNFSTKNNNIDNNNNNTTTDNLIPKRKILSKELESLGAYLPNENDYYDEDEEYTELEQGEEEYINEEEEEQSSSTLPKHLQYNNSNNGENEEMSKYGKKFTDMIYRIKENHELSEKHSIDLLNDLEFDSFEELEKKLDEKLAKKYQEKMETLESMEQTDFEDKDVEKVELYNEISNNFIPANTHFETPFEKTEKQLENNEIKRPMGLSSMINASSTSTSSSSFQQINQSDDISSRISKIKQRIQKDKLVTNRISNQNLDELFSLYRQDPIANNASVLAKKYGISEQTMENLLKYTTIPIIVKFNTGIKSGHWNVQYFV